MNPERWQQVEALYRAAQHCGPETRAALLARADPELRREVEALLAQEESAAMTTVVGALTQLGPYKIEARLGAGGMGEVFRARDTRLGRTVAIKILPRDKVADPERKRRFLQEARAASALNHPNIVTLHDIASDNGIDYLVMEYVPGKSLDKLITPKGLPLAEVIGYTTQIASALAAAHAAGIVHRDIKPANVIVTQESQVKVLDFGLAKLTEPDAAAETLTEAGTVVGTVAYMSPEQASARPLDHGTDIFSLEHCRLRKCWRELGLSAGSRTRDHARDRQRSRSRLRACVGMEDILDKALAEGSERALPERGDMAVDLRRAQRSAPSAVLRRRRAAGPGHGWRLHFRAGRGGRRRSIVRDAPRRSLEPIRSRGGPRSLFARIPTAPNWTPHCHPTGISLPFFPIGTFPSMHSWNRWAWGTPSTSPGGAFPSCFTSRSGASDFPAMEASCGCGSPRPIPPAAR